MKTRALQVGFWVLLVLALNNSRAALALDALKEAEDRREPLAPALVLAEHSPHANQRLRAARALGRIQRPETIAPLLALAQDPNLDVRLEAVFALGQLGWEAGFTNGREAEISGALAKLLADKNARLRRTAAEAIGKIGLATTPSLIGPALADSNPQVRSEGLIALYRHRLVLRLRDAQATIADLPAATVQAVVKLTSDPAATVRRSAAYVFARVKMPANPELLPPLLKLTTDPETWVRYFAVTGLSKQDPTALLADVTAALQQASTDPVSNIRVAAIQGLTTLKTEPATQQASKLAIDPSQAVRSALALASSNETVLQTLSQDRSTAVRADSLRRRASVAKTAADASALLTTGLADSSWVIRQAAAEAAGTSPLLDDASRLALLARARKDADFRVRATSIDGYAGVAGSEAFLAIRDALHSSELSERGSAAGALSSRTEPEVAQAAWDCYQLSTGEKWVEVREGLISVLAAIPGDPTGSWLQAAIADPAPSVSGAAIRALLARGVTGLPQPPALTLSFSPYRELTFKKNPMIHLETDRGEIVLELFAQEAPIHVANIVGFVKTGAYDGLPVHRVVPNFVIQGGDPDKSGWGSAGYALRAEINRRPFLRGTLGMPRSTGFDTGGVQFFINHVPTPNLDGQYTVFGQVRRGMPVVDQIEVGDLVQKAWVE